MPGPAPGQLCICQQCPWPLKGPAGHTSEKDSGAWTETSWPALAISMAAGSSRQVPCDEALKGQSPGTSLGAVHGGGLWRRSLSGYHGSEARVMLLLV